MRSFAFFLVFSLFYLFSNESQAFENPRPDSVGVKVENGQKYILHRVEKSEGLFSISRRYNVNIDDLMKANPQAEDGLVLNEIIRVPIKEKRKDATYHKVAPKETLYSLSREYNVSVDQIMEWNQMEETNLIIGEELIISIEGEEIAEPTADEIAEEVAEASDKAPKEKDADEEAEKDPLETAYEEKLSDLDDKTYYEEREEKGTAYWMDDTYMKSRKSLALHKSAPPGTIIKITNLMNNKSTYVKVVGFLDEADKQSAQLITISKVAAEQLDVQEYSFRAKLEYVTRKED